MKAVCFEHVNFQQNTFKFNKRQGKYTSNSVYSQKFD